MNPNKVETRLREIAERSKRTPFRYAVENIDGKYIVSRHRDFYSGVRALKKLQRIGGVDAYELNELPQSKPNHSRQDVPWLLKLEKKRRGALEQIVSLAQLQCKQSCKQHYLPRGTHAPECPLELLEIARDALNFAPEKL